MKIIHIWIIVGCVVQGLFAPSFHVRFPTFILSTVLKWGSLYLVSVKEHSVQRWVHWKDSVVDVVPSSNEDFQPDQFSSLGIMMMSSKVNVLLNGSIPVIVL